MPPKAKKPKVVKAAPKALSLEQQKQLLLTPCKTEQELKNFIKYFLGLELPDCKVSRYADTDPFHAVWLIYNICVNKVNPDNIKELLYVAGRGTGKTIGVAIAELLVMLHDARDVAHIGAILSQAKRCYEYQSKFLLSDKLKNIVMPVKVPEDQRILEKHNMEKSVFNVFDRDSNENAKVTIEVLPATLKAVNGSHVPLICVDEVDTISGEGVRAFKDISGMLDSKGDKIALRVSISTRKTRYGLMNQQIENADKEGRTVKRWTAFEFTERCPDSRSGTDPIDLYINQDRMETITPAEFAKKDMQKKKEYELVRAAGPGCASCPIFPICKSDAKNQKSKSPMLKPIDDLIKKATENGADWALAQLMNLKPSVEGIVFKEFDESLHMVSWSAMWKTLTGKEFPGECTHDIFVKKCHEMKLSCYAGVDWGFTSPSTVVYFFVDRRENVYVVRCDGRTHYSNPDWIHHIKHKWHNLYRCQLYFPDLANPGDGEEMRKAGLPVPSTVEKNIDSGVQVLKKWLKSLASPVPKMFFASETCQPLKTEMNLIHYKVDSSGQVTDTIAEGNDHFCVTPDTLIVTENGSKPINSIQVGEKVLTHDGTYQKVNKVMISEVDEEINELYSMGRRKLNITKNHPVLTHELKRSHTTENGKKLTGQVRFSGEPAFIKSGDIKVTRSKTDGGIKASLFPRSEFSNKEAIIDFSNYLPAWKETEDGCYIKGLSGSGLVIKNFKITKEFAFLMGYFLADGSCSGTIKQPNGIMLSGHIKEVEVGRIIAMVCDQLGTKATSKFLKTDPINGKSIYINSVPLYAFFKSFGANENKTLNPIWHDLNEEQLSYLLYGYLFGDGFFGGQGVESNTISPSIGYQILSIYTKLGIPASILKLNRENNAWPSTKHLRMKDQYVVGAGEHFKELVLNKINEDELLGAIFSQKLVRYQGTKINSNKQFINKYGTWSSIKSITSKSYKGLVYNLEVDANNSYVANGITVHNCDALRYPMYGLFGKSQAMVAAYGLDIDYMNNNKQPDGSFMKTPTAAEYAAAKGVLINTEIDTSNLGKIGTASELNNDDDENSASGGGFLWSF